MAQSIIRSKTQKAPQVDTYSHSLNVERWLRQGSALLILYFLLQAELGLAWDRQWHDLVGRDRFWIPPHILMYSGIGAAGLITLAVVILETVRYYQKKPGVDDTSTIQVLSYFHAPLGFVLLGFGALTDLLAAPLDNYWHQLYGLDVTLWSPFHIMGTIGGAILALGGLYMFASEAAYERQKGPSSWRILGLSGPEWGIAVLLAAFMEFTLPSLTAFQPTMVGTLKLFTYPFPLVLTASTLLISAVLTIRKPGAATITALIVWVEALATQAFIPWALNETVTRFGFNFRYSGITPSFNVSLSLMPILFLICAIFVDVVAYRQWRQQKTESKKSLRGVWLIGAIVTLPAVFVPPAIVHSLLLLFPGMYIPADVLRTLQPSFGEMLLVFPLALAVGIVFALVGAAFGDIWHLSKQ